MQRVTLDIRDDYLEKFIHILDALPHGMVHLKQDEIEVELAERVRDIDNGSETLTPYLDGIDAMLTRVKNRHADS